jgi:hypothetical protein
MTTTRPHPLWIRHGAGRALLLSALLAGCSGPPSAAPPTAPAALATPSGPGDAGPPTIQTEKADRKAVLAGLKDATTGSADARGIEIRAYRFSGLTEPLEVLVQIERSRDPKGHNGLETISLITEGPPIPQGIVRMILLPPEATGREGARVVLQVVPDGPGRAQVLSRDVSPLWFGWAKRRLMSQSSLVQGKPQTLRRGKGPPLVGYSSRDPATGAEVILELRCRLVSRSGG